jgi:hypothetical protein
MNRVRRGFAGLQTSITSERKFASLRVCKYSAEFIAPDFFQKKCKTEQETYD